MTDDCIDGGTSWTTHQGPEAIGHVIVFLASDEATGIDLPVDGDNFVLDPEGRQRIFLMKNDE